MAAWRLFRHRNADGSFKDWAVRTSHPDGTMSTRWGKTAARLPGFSTRSGVRQADIERAKQAKGYVFVAEVDIDNQARCLSNRHQVRLNRSTDTTKPPPCQCR